MNSGILQSFCKLHNPNRISRIFLLQFRLVNYTTCSYTHKYFGVFRQAAPGQKAMIVSPLFGLRKVKSIRVLHDINRKPPDVDVLVENLEKHFNLNGNVNYGLVETLLNVIEKLPLDVLTIEQSCFLLSACGLCMPAETLENRLIIFNRVWSYLVENKQCSTEHYLTKMKVLQHNRVPLSDFGSFIKEVCNVDRNADVPELYSELLKVSCCCGDMRQATQLLAEMRDLKIALRETDFNALIIGHARNREIDGCQRVLENMLAACVPLSSETHTVLTVAYLENSVFSKATEILSKHLSDFNANQIITILRSTLRVNVEDTIIKKMVSALPSNFVNGSEVPSSLRNLCIELLHNNKLDIVITIMCALPQPEFNSNQDHDTFGKFLLHELFAIKTKSEKIVEVAQLLKTTKKNERALHIATDIASRLCPSKSLSFLEALAKVETLRPHYFWPILIYNYHKLGENGIFRTLKYMKKYLACDQETLTKYILPRLTTVLENPQRSVKMLTENGFKTSQVLLPVMAHTLMQQKYEEAYILAQTNSTKLDTSQLVMPLSNLAVNVRATKRYQQFTKLLAALATKTEDRNTDFIGLVLVDMVRRQARLRSDLEAVKSVINAMHKYGLTVSPVAVDNFKMSFQEQQKNQVFSEVLKILQEMVNRKLTFPNIIDNGSGSNGSFVKHPRSMSFNELESHLVELESKGLNTRGVLRRLLQVCVRENRLERALEIKAECDQLNVYLSPGMMASVFDLHIKLKDLSKAKQAYEQITKRFPGFTIDEHKIIDFAALFVSENQLQTSKQLLTDRAAKEIPIGGDYVVKNIWNFLTCVANLATRTPNLTSEQNLTREAFAFLHQLGYTTPQNAVLGPIVREFLLRFDIKSAVKEFRRIAEQYKHTPLQFELLSLLVRLGNADVSELKRFSVDVQEAQELLCEVIAITTKVHGVVNMNSALVLAFAESGNDKQLRRLLIDPDFRLNQELLIKNCDYLGEEGSIRTLLRLALASRGLHHVVKEQDIYNMLLSKFADSNNYEAAIQLFNHLETDDELKISNEFLRGLVNLLNFNNLEIPSNLAIRAQVM